MLESLNAPMAVALCRYHGVRKNGVSDRAYVKELQTLGDIFDHAEGDEFMEGFLKWVLQLASKDLDNALGERFAQIHNAE